MLALLLPVKLGVCRKKVFFRMISPFYSAFGSFSPDYSTLSQLRYLWLTVLSRYPPPLLLVSMSGAGLFRFFFRSD